MRLQGQYSLTGRLLAAADDAEPPAMTFRRPVQKEQRKHSVYGQRNDGALEEAMVQVWSYYGYCAIVWLSSLRVWRFCQQYAYRRNPLGEVVAAMYIALLALHPVVRSKRSRG